jgi:periplasmic protein TonB
MGGIKPNSREQKPTAVITLGKMTSIQAKRDSPRPSAPHNAAAAAKGSNIVLFSRPERASAAPPIVVRAEDRPAPWWPYHHGRRLMPLFLLCALALHAGLYALEREPVPLASINEVSIAVDILLGAQVAPGLASTPSPAVAAQAEPQEPDQPAKAEAADPIVEEAPAQPQSAAPDSQPQASTEPSPPVSKLVATPSPTGSMAPKPPVIERKQPAVERKQPALERKPSAVEHKPAQKTREQPTAREARLHPAERGRATPSTPSTPSSGVGPGRSDVDSNYPGRVYAHLARYQRAPSDGGQGVARVTISLDGSGRVLGVRLTQSSGNAGFDQEAQALVRRASPLPPPPGAKPLTLGWSVRLR